MSNAESGSGYAVFERICRDIESGLMHWVERVVERGPYDARSVRQQAGEAGDDSNDEVLRA